MSKKQLITFSLVGTLVALLTGSAMAQEPQPTSSPQVDSPAPAVQPTQNAPRPQPNAAIGTQLGTALSYQGQLQKSGGAYNGICTFQFSLWDAVTEGAQVGSTITRSDVAIANGLFGVELDFGNQFNGDMRWLETAVQCAGDADFTTLAPRQPQNAGAYAISLRPGSAVKASSVSAEQVVTNNFSMVNGGKQLDILTGGAIDIQSATDVIYIHSRLSGYGCLENCEGATFIQPFGGLVGIGTNTPQATLDVNGTSRSRVVEITGGSDLAERFEQGDGKTAEPGTVMIADEANPGKLRVSNAAYDSKVIGIVSGAGGINTGLTLHQEGTLAGDVVVAVAGRVYAKCDATTSAIKPGDLLTTSSAPGHCMKASDRDRRDGAVIGKAMTGLKDGKGLVLVVVNLQ